jgi:hypothetical protein
MNHRFSRRGFYSGYFSFVTGFRPILLAVALVLVDIDFDDISTCNRTQRGQNRLDEKLPGAGNSRTHVSVVVRQTLMEHDAVSQGDFLFEFVKILLAACHF